MDLITTDSVEPFESTSYKISVTSGTDRGIVVTGITGRLFIRSYSDIDYAFSQKLYSDALLTKYFDHGTPRKNHEIDEYLSERARIFFDRGEPYGIFSVFLNDSNDSIGQIDLVPTGVPGELEIGWIFLKKFQGKGYCSESVQSFLLPFVTELAQKGVRSSGSTINRIIATAHPENKASQRVIEKSGLTHYLSQPRYGGKPRNWYKLDLETRHGSN